LIESHLPLVRSIARRYAGRGENLDDLVQVGALGLIRASDRFDPERGVTFATFATPAIEGEIRRHLGDRTTSVRIPRELQRMSGELARGRTRLSASLGHEPTVDELATELGVEREEVELALEAERAREQMPEPSDDVAEAAGAAESLASTDDRLLLERGARVLDEREQRIVFLRFHADMTERDIASEIGVSQAQVSRLLTGALAKLRDELADEEAPEPPAQPTGQRRRSTRSGKVAGTRIAVVGASQQKGASEPVTASQPAADSAPQRGADLALPYHVTVKPEGEEAGSGWLAAIEDLPGCEARGASPEEAVEQLRASMETWLSAAVEGRRVIPPREQASSKPKPASSHSGRFLVRMPSDLHHELSLAAERERVSLNRFVTAALAASVSSTGASLSAGPVAGIGHASGSSAQRKRSFRMLLAANVMVIVFATAAAIALLILALERGI
jgi:RNA polymerase sigma-B factor